MPLTCSILFPVLSKASLKVGATCAVRETFTTIRSQQAQFVIGARNSIGNNCLAECTKRFFGWVLHTPSLPVNCFFPVVTLSCDKKATVSITERT